MQTLCTTRGDEEVDGHVSLCWALRAPGGAEVAVRLQILHDEEEGEVKSEQPEEEEGGRMGTDETPLDWTHFNGTSLPQRNSASLLHHNAVASTSSLAGRERDSQSSAGEVEVRCSDSLVLGAIAKDLPDLVDRLTGGAWSVDIELLERRISGR